LRQHETRRRYAGFAFASRSADLLRDAGLIEAGDTASPG